MTLEQLLFQLGINLASSFVYEKVRDYFKNGANPTVDGLKGELVSYLNIQDADIKAGKIVEFLAQKGDINISGTRVYASDSITMTSSRNTKFAFGDNSSSRTDKSSIKAGHGAQIVGQGGAKIEQDKDGNIKISA